MNFIQQTLFVILIICCISLGSTIAFQCNGKDPLDNTVCNSRGDCIAENNCKCNDGYVGNDCEYTVCYGQININPLVCSEHGSCNAPDTCTCKDNYSDFECGTAPCNGTSAEDSKVCNSHGRCYELDKCDCQTGYAGVYCEIDTHTLEGAEIIRQQEQDNVNKCADLSYNVLADWIFAKLQPIVQSSKTLNDVEFYIKFFDCYMAMIQNPSFKKETNFEIDSLEQNFIMMNTLIGTTFGKDYESQINDKYLQLGAIIESELCETRDKTSLDRSTFFSALNELLTRYYLLTKDYSLHLQQSLYCLNRIVGRMIKPEQKFQLQSSFLGSYVTRNHYYSDGTFNFTSPWAVLTFDRSSFASIHKKYTFEIDISISAFENEEHFNSTTIFTNSSFIKFDMFTENEKQTTIGDSLDQPLSIAFKPKSGEFDVESAKGFFSLDKYECQKLSQDNSWTSYPDVYLDSVEKEAIICKTRSSGLYRAVKLSRTWWDRFAYIVYGLIVLLIILCVTIIMAALCISGIIYKRAKNKQNNSRIRLPDGDMDSSFL